MGSERVLRRNAPAKLNLFLQVTGRRPDGYHLVESWVVFLDVGDEVIVAPADDFSLLVEGSFASALESADKRMDNIVVKAASQLAASIGVAPRAAVRLIKNLPVASGLGGGSSDAAAALYLLAKLWRSPLSERNLDDIALRLGADVPVCRRARSQWVQGVGERLSEAPALPPASFVLVFPGISLSTAEVFALLRPPWSDAGGPPEVATDVTHLAALLLRRRNDLERPASLLACEVRRALNVLTVQPGCLLARMSGAGSTCFGLFASPEGASSAADGIRRGHPDWWVVPAQSV